MPINHTFILNHPLFQDWKIILDVEQFNELEELIAQIKAELRLCLAENNFHVLRNISLGLHLKIIDIENIAQLKQAVNQGVYRVDEILPN
jgi:hypothetical protein